MGELALPMWLGSLIIAVVISIPLYPLTLKAVRSFQEEELNSSEQSESSDKINESETQSKETVEHV